MRQLRLLHLPLVLGPVLFTAILVFLRSTGPTSATGVPPMIPLVILGFAVMMILSAAVLRTRIPPMESGSNADEWAARNKTQCLILWMVLEGSAILCAVALFLGADPWLAGGLAAGALGFLASQSPGAVAGH